MESAIKKLDIIQYTCADDSTFIARVEGVSSYQGQPRVNLRVMASSSPNITIGEMKGSYQANRCKKLTQDEVAKLTGQEISVKAGETIVETEGIGVEKVEFTGEFFTFGSVKIPIRKLHPSTQHLIPKKRTYFIEEKRKDDFEDIFDSATKFENILCVGEPGCGKSEFVLWLCAETNIPIVQIQGDGEMSVVDMVGGFQYSEEKGGTYWIDGIIPFAVRHKCWILFDEINMTLPEVLSRLHSVMDDRRHLDLKEINEILLRSDDTVIFGTMNPSDDGRHVGTKPLSPALWSRFNLIVNFDFLEAKNEIKLLIDRTGISQTDAEKMVTFAAEARKGFVNNEVSEVVDTRMLLNWAKKTKVFGLKRGLKNTILSRLDKESLDVLRGVLISYGVVDPEGRDFSEKKKKSNT